MARKVANSAMIIHVINGAMVDVMVFGRKEEVTLELIQEYKSNGAIAFDRTVRTDGGGYERFTMYNYFHR